jgi:hypothetical protein
MCTHFLKLGSPSPHPALLALLDAKCGARLSPDARHLLVALFDTTCKDVVDRDVPAPTMVRRWMEKVATHRHLGPGVVAALHDAGFAVA